MSPASILALYLVLCGLYFLWETFLTLLNHRHVRLRATDPPAFASEIMDRPTFQRSVRYTLTKIRFGLLSSAASSAFLLLLVLSGALGRIESLVLHIPMGGYVRGVLYFFVVALLFGLFSLPFAAYSQFAIEQRYGFNRMTWSLFALDTLKGALLSLVLLSPLLLGLFWFMDTAGDLWWIYAFAGFFLFQLVLLVLYPTVIAPLFNRFWPLEEGSLREKISALAEALGFRTSGVFVMDGSKRSGHGNAYFTGLGGARRIVLFDTLIQSMDEDQLVAVLAHEIGHEKRRHVIKSLAVTAAVTLVGFWLLSLLLHADPVFRAFGFEAASRHAAVVLVTFFAAPLTFFLKPVLALWSRRHEYEADRFAVDAMQGHEELRGALIRLSRKNLSNLIPHPLYSFYHYSHPSLAERLQAMRSYSVERGYSRAQGGGTDPIDSPTA